ARTGSNRGDLVSDHVRYSETMCRGWRDRERQTTTSPSREPLPHRVHRIDVETGSEQQLVEAREVPFHHAPKRRGDETRRTATHERQRDVPAFHARGELADPLRCREGTLARQWMIALQRGDRSVRRGRVVVSDDQSAG